ncbi:hypothetical protein [Propioniciclava tarda]|uniref:Uncharacterized protein n=1 Tax=Propioniciclava tarda TaxID=433330 RepID=A0A4V2JSV9_PROTD|nr:hypothetical protein [Propioniciclava tarda]TBT92091.1 hypothetical protein ET996_13600 [Propioniciclava tarda]SMO82647.1 hypothetical protein SAMN06266982_1235 [Propioniciclava tarda]HOA89702.1 hypothetical protein [Propioniciclava tarda]HQA31797.1 hypothetical protein [Propioniciclava tarda]HQD61527.1 hypothetical protein [Propioniciclava tarda]
MGRVVITKETVQGFVAQGLGSHQVPAGAIVTDSAKEFARDKGFSLVFSDAALAAPRPVGVAPAASNSDLARRVRSAVIAQLGHAPEGLDAVIAKVLASL